MFRRIVGALALGVFLLACDAGERTRPPPECRTFADCPPGEQCEDGTCRRHQPDGCNPPCGGSQPICDEVKGYCKVCTETSGCGGGTPFCAIAANGGEGACVGCRDDLDCAPPSLCDPETHACAGCTATSGCSGETPICSNGTCVACTETEGCGGDRPICDPTIAGGTCVRCTAAVGCEEGTICDHTLPGGACVTCTAELGCGGETPACDITVPGGECVECVADDDCPDGLSCDEASLRCVTCTANHEGCAAPTPVCDPAAGDGRGECVGCLSDLDCGGPAPVCHPEHRRCVACGSDLDCGGATPRCDPNASEGAGACVGCVDPADCDGATPVCDRAANDGLGACVACTDTQGCGTGRFCDVSVPGGACVVCTEARGCGGPTPVCDTSVPGGACVVCDRDSDCTVDPGRPLCDHARTALGECVWCTADHRGCDGETPYCLTGANWGAGVCRRCTPAEGCSGATPVCDPGVDGAACAVCTATQGCGGATPVCDTATPGGACKRCTAGGTGCGGSTPACDVTAAGGLGACVRCVSNADCANPTPACDTATHTCGCLASTDCAAPTPVCDVSVRRCAACTPTEGCGGDQPFCGSVDGQPPSCLECLVPQDCEPEVETCDPTGSCWNVAASFLLDVRQSNGTTVLGATVTYLKPPVGTEPGGFFLQVQPFGPALFVAVPPSSLSPPPAVGDRVYFQVAGRSTVDGMLHLTSLSNWQVWSGGHPIALLIQEISGNAVITVRPYQFESEVVALTGRLEAFAPAGAGYVAAPIETAALGPIPQLQLRVPQALRESLDLGQNCVVTLLGVPFWRSSTAALPSAYAPGDFTSITCPAPQLVGAAATSATQVRLDFDRVLDPASVLADGSQFVVSPPLAVTAAAVVGTQATLTTAAQDPGALYTVTVASTVHGLHGAALAPPGTATFSGAP